MQNTILIKPLTTRLHKRGCMDLHRLKFEATTVNFFKRNPPTPTGSIAMASRQRPATASATSSGVVAGNAHLQSQRRAPSPEENRAARTKEQQQHATSAIFIKEGFVQMQGSTFGMWKRRFVIIMGGVLLYSKRRGAKPRALTVSGCIITSGELAIPNKSHTLMIHNAASGNRFLSCVNQEEQQAWMAALQASARWNPAHNTTGPSRAQIAGEAKLKMDLAHAQNLTAQYAQNIDDLSREATTIRRESAAQAHQAASEIEALRQRIAEMSDALAAADMASKQNLAPTLALEGGEDGLPTPGGPKTLAEAINEIETLRSARDKARVERDTAERHQNQAEKERDEAEDHRDRSMTRVIELEAAIQKAREDAEGAAVMAKARARAEPQVAELQQAEQSTTTGSATPVPPVSGTPTRPHPHGMVTTLSDPIEIVMQGGDSSLSSLSPSKQSGLKTEVRRAVATTLGITMAQVSGMVLRAGSIIAHFKLAATDAAEVAHLVSDLKEKSDELGQRIQHATGLTMTGLRLLDTDAGDQISPTTATVDGTDETTTAGPTESARKKASNKMARVRKRLQLTLQAAEAAEKASVKANEDYVKLEEIAVRHVEWSQGWADMIGKMAKNSDLILQASQLVEEF